MDWIFIPGFLPAAKCHGHAELWVEKNSVTFAFFDVVAQGGMGKADFIEWIKADFRE